MVPRALEAAEALANEHGIDAEVIDLRSLVPLETQTILSSVAKTGRLFTVEENPRLCGWGAEMPPSSPTKRFGISTDRSCASQLRTFRCRPPIILKTWRCPAPRESPTRCGAC